MCCFSGPVEQVSGTHIYARLQGSRQLLAYQMRFASAGEVAMVLPLPVPAGTAEDAVRFIDLSKERYLFSTLEASFPSLEVSRAADSAVEVEEAAPMAALEVHQVGSFEASFLPSAKDFARLDARFRLTPDVLSALPGADDRGFVVFKLRPSAGDDDAHPMAFDFPSRDAGRAFFPCVHVHDGRVHAEADFDHHLYVQFDAKKSAATADWQRSLGVLPADSAVFDGHALAFRTRLEGQLPNRDVWLDAVDESPADAALRDRSIAERAAQARQLEKIRAESRRARVRGRITRAVLAAPVVLLLGFVLFTALGGYLHHERDSLSGSLCFGLTFLASTWVFLEALTGKPRVASLVTGLALVALGIVLFVAR